jgi:voltage-gated potassium channel Kch
VLALSSTAIVLQSLREKGLLRSEAGERSFALLLFQDLAVIPMLIVLPFLGSGGAGAAPGSESPGWIASLSAPARALATLTAVGAIVLGGRYGMRPLFRVVARRGTRETFTAMALLIVVGMVGIHAYYGDASREELLRAAGAKQARVLIVATGSLESMQAVIRTARAHFPQLRIFARARTRIEAYELLESGVERVYRASLDTSLRSGADVLHELGFSEELARGAAERFRHHDEAALRELAGIHRDSALFESRARESNRVLERLLRAELQRAVGAEDRSVSA